MSVVDPLTTSMQVDRISPDWVRACALVDELWLPSRHLIGAFVSAGVNASLLRHAIDESIGSIIIYNDTCAQHIICGQLSITCLPSMKIAYIKSISKHLFFTLCVDFHLRIVINAESCPRRSTRPRSHHACIANWSLSRCSLVQTLGHWRLRTRRHWVRRWTRLCLFPKNPCEASEYRRRPLRMQRRRSQRITCASNRFRGRRSSRAASTISSFSQCSSGRSARVGMCCYAPISTRLQCLRSPLVMAADTATISMRPSSIPSNSPLRTTRPVRTMLLPLHLPRIEPTCVWSSRATFLATPIRTIRVAFAN
jgi:hypothetical protein